MAKVGVVIPAYKATGSILNVLSRMPAMVTAIYVIDDCCPLGTGKLVEANTTESRIKVLFRPENGGVGAAMKTGYLAALEVGCDVIVKIDSDGQMAPEILADIAAPVLQGIADYSKGNRFWNVHDVRGMPMTRVLGNAGVSLLSKLSTGYWHLFDPANGYTAISSEALRSLPLNLIADRYFFESDMLFRLALDRRRVADVPMKAVYANEVSGLKVWQTVLPFSWRYMVNFFKRLVIEYLLRDFNLASVAFIVAATTLPIGLVSGVWSLIRGWMTGQPSPTSSVVLIAILLIIGYVSLMNFFAYDYAKVDR